MWPLKVLLLPSSHSTHVLPSTWNVRRNLSSGIVVCSLVEKTGGNACKGTNKRGTKGKSERHSKAFIAKVTNRSYISLAVFQAGIYKKQNMKPLISVLTPATKWPPCSFFFLFFFYQYNHLSWMLQALRAGLVRQHWLSIHSTTSLWSREQQPRECCLSTSQRLIMCWKPISFHLCCGFPAWHLTAPVK